MTGPDGKKYWWMPGFAAAFFAVGVQYWWIPYGKVNLPEAVIGYGLLILSIAAMLARVYSEKSLLRVTMVMGLAVPAVVAVRVALEVARDATSHNLWPLEIIIAVVVGGMAALSGALAGSVVLRLLRRKRDHETAG